MTYSISVECPDCGTRDVLENRHGSVCLTCNRQYSYNLTDFEERFAIGMKAVMGAAVLNVLGRLIEE